MRGNCWCSWKNLIWEDFGHVKVSFFLSPMRFLSIKIMRFQRNQQVWFNLQESQILKTTRSIRANETKSFQRKSLSKLAYASIWSQWDYSVIRMCLRTTEQRKQAKRRTEKSENWKCWSHWNHKLVADNFLNVFFHNLFNQLEPTNLWEIDTLQ